MGNFVGNLPSDSATARALYPGNAWSQTDHLLATVIDLLAAGNWQRGGNAKARRPKALKRPGARESTESVEDIKARIAAYDEEHRGGD